MATVLYTAAASLDGFIAGPDGDMSWLGEYVGQPNPTADEVLARTGALLVGHVTFRGDDPNRGTEAEGAFGGRYDGPVVVLAHQPPAEPPAGVEFATDLRSAVARACELAGEGYVDVLGADVAAQCAEAGLLDEVLVFFAPVLLGAGTRLFTRRHGGAVRLEPLPGRAPHWYRVVR